MIPITRASDGHVLAWGENLYGELGDGTTTDSPTPVPVDLPAGTRIAAVGGDGDGDGDGDSLALAVHPSWRHWPPSRHQHTRPRHR